MRKVSEASSCLEKICKETASSAIYMAVLSISQFDSLQILATGNQSYISI